MKIIEIDELYREISDLIDNAKIEIAGHINSTQISLYWNIGTRINIDILENKRAKYGNKLLG